MRLDVQRVCLRWCARAGALGLCTALACHGDQPTGLNGASCQAGTVAPLVIAVGAYVSLDPASSAGCVVFPPNASATDSVEYLVVPQSAPLTPVSSSAFLLQGSSAAMTAPAMASPVLAPTPTPPRLTARAFDRTLRQAEATRSYAAAPRALVQAEAGPTAAAAPGPPAVGSLRTFQVCSALTCTSFNGVTGRVQTVGAHIAVYVDTLAPANGLNAADLDTLTTLFDNRLYPTDTTAFGRESDVDANGVVVVLMTGAVNSLVSKSECSSGGFVAGFFFSADLDPTVRTQFSNGEVFYSIVADPLGALSCSHSRGEVKRIAPVTFVHEFQHMINFVQHVLVRGKDPEAGWLDEGLSKYAEELAGRSFLPGDPATFNSYVSNDIYDAYQYLAATGDSPLLIPQDDGTLAEIGASWLFTRYLVDQFGPSLPQRLVGSATMGGVNVSLATGQSFVALLARWALANWVSDLPGFTAPSELTYTSWAFRTTFASAHSQDPTHFPQAYPLIPTASAGAAVNLTGTLRSGSQMHQRAFQGPGAPGFSLLFSTDGSVPLPSVVVPRLTILRIR